MRIKLFIHFHSIIYVKQISQQYLSIKISLIQLYRFKLYITLQSLTNIRAMKNLILQQIQQLKQSKKSKSNPAKTNLINQQKWKAQSFKKEADSKSNASSNTTSHQSQLQSIKGRDLFQGLSFCFPFVDIELSPRRIELMSQSILKEGGKIIQFRGKIIEEKADYILVNPKICVQVVAKKLEGKMQYKFIMDFNYVINCLKEGVFLAIATYNLGTYQIEEDEDEKKTVTMTQALRKITKTESKLQHQDDSYVVQGKKLIRGKSKANQANQKKDNQPLMEKQGDCLTDTESMAEKQQEDTLTSVGRRTFSMNKFICDKLMEMQRIYESAQDIGRKIAYLKAVSSIRNLTKQIENSADVDGVRGIGEKIKKKIKEILATGGLQKLHQMQQSDKMKACQNLCGVWGIGPLKAEELYSKNIKSVQELRQRDDLDKILTKSMRIGLKFYQDFQKKIPRQKVEVIATKIREQFLKIVGPLQNYHFQVCGSFRRKKAVCGDIDMIIARKDGYYDRNLLINLVQELETKGILTNHLTFPSQNHNKRSQTYMGVCRLKTGPFHRIDIKHYPIDEYPFALLYFTGSAMFNRAMRLHATKLGLKLSDHEIAARKNRKVVWKQPIPRCENEQDIFKLLGMQYKSPQERDL